jgi:hypothetical protein
MTASRRRFIAGIASVTGSLSLAGCVADEFPVDDVVESGDDTGGTGDDAEGTGDDAEGTSGEDPTSDVELTDTTFETADGVTRGTFEFTNDGEQDAEFDFGAAVHVGTDGVYGTHRSERTATVPAGETATTEMVLVERRRLSQVAENEFNEGYIEIVLTMNGQEADRVVVGEQPSHHVSFRVLYDDQWGGAIGGESGIRNVQGSGTEHLPVDNDAAIVSGNAQKQDQSTRRLLVQIIVDGDIVAEQATTASFGVAQVSARTGDSPISNPAVPYEPPEVTVANRETPTDTTWSTGNEADVPDEREAVTTAEAYYDALVGADPDALNALLHPDSPMEEFTDEDVSGFERFDHEIEDIEVASLDRDRGIAVVRSVVVLVERESSSRERIQSALELRVYDGQWRLWQIGE